MKTTTKQLVIWCIVAFIAAGFTACEDKYPVPELTENSLENTVWKLETEAQYSKAAKKWEEINHSDIVPGYLMQFIDGKYQKIYSSANYSIDTQKGLLKSGGNPEQFIHELTDSKLTVETRSALKLRYTYTRIPLMQPAKLYGRWQITALQQHDIYNGWTDKTFDNSYWIEFNKNGSGKNSAGGDCKYSISGNIVDINCTYGESFVVELTDNRLVFVHNYKATKLFTKETFKKIK